MLTLSTIDTCNDVELMNFYKQYSLQLGECRTLWGKCERAAQWFGNVAEFEQGQNRCCQHHMAGIQGVATAVFSQHHHDKSMPLDYKQCGACM